MKKAILLLVFLVMSSSLAFTQFNWETELKIKNNLGYEFDSLFIGVLNSATDGLDLGLGEEDLPTFEPPQTDIFCYFHLKNGTEDLWSYRDYRAVPEEENFKKEYLLYINYGAGTSIDISWGDFGEEIDSAYIEDIFDDVFIFKANMKTTKTVNVKNHYSREHKITIWYNKKGSSIAENTEKNDIFVYPNPAENNILLQNAGLNGNVKIYNEYGTCVIDSEYYGDKINISSLAVGTYFLKYNNTITNFIKL